MKESITILMIFIFLSGCMKIENGNYPDNNASRDSACIFLNFVFEKDSHASKGISIDDREISDMNVYISDKEGNIVEHKYFEHGAPGKITLNKDGKEYSAYAIANTGKSINVRYGEDIEKLRHTISSPEQIASASNGAIMSGKQNGTFTADSDQGITIELKRCISKILVRVDTTELDSGVEINVKKITLKNSPRSINFFCPSKAESKDDVFDSGDSKTGNELEWLYGSGCELFMFENMQGDLLPGITDQKDKVFPNGDERAGTCTYLELQCDYDSDIQTGLIIYRIYIGENTLENFDITRNKIYSIDISFTGTGINEMTWRVEDGILKFYASLIYLFPMRSEILPGESTNINCAVFPQMTYNNKVSWESSDPSVCEVDQLGKITGISEGKATITATATDRNIVSESVEITVFPYAQEVEITESAEIFLNDTLRIKPSTRPLGSAEYIRWSSSDPDICSVDQNGLVKGVNIGKAVITAFADDGSGLYDECEVSVSYAPLERIEILGPDYIIDKEFSTGEETYAEYSIRIHPANADPYYGLEWDLYEKGSNSHADAVARKTMQSDESGGGVFRLQAVPYQKGTTDRTRGTVTLKARYGSKSVSKDISIYEYAPIDPQWNGSSLIDENFIENYGSMFRISFECDKLWQGYNFIGASATMFNFTSGFTMMDLAGQVYPKNANEAKALRKQLKITSGGGFEGEDNLYFEIVPE